MTDNLSRETSKTNTRQADSGGKRGGVGGDCVCVCVCVCVGGGGGGVRDLGRGKIPEKKNKSGRLT